MWICLRSWIYQGTEYRSGSKYSRVLSTPSFWICQGSEYDRVLNMPGFWIWQGFEYTKVLNMSGFWIYQYSEYSKVLNIPQLWIFQGSEYLFQGSEYAMVLNLSGFWIYRDYKGFWLCLHCSWVIPEYARVLNTNSTLLQPVSLRSQFAIFENSVKKNLHYFRKTIYRRCLRKMWICLGSWIYQNSEYGRVLYTLSVKKKPELILVDQNY